jgi:hypothetical protein
MQTVQAGTVCHGLVTSSQPVPAPWGRKTRRGEARRQGPVTGGGGTRVPSIRCPQIIARFPQRTSKRTRVEVRWLSFSSRSVHVSTTISACHGTSRASPALSLLGVCTRPYALHLLHPSPQISINVRARGHFFVAPSPPQTGGRFCSVLLSKRPSGNSRADDDREN